MDDQRRSLRAIVRGAYDMQKLRIETGNRIVANFKARLGQRPGHKEEEIEAEGRNLLNALRAAYRKITDAVKTFPRPGNFKGDELISSYTELCLVAQYEELAGVEAQHFKRLGNAVKQFSIWDAFLDGVKGVGPAMAGVLLSEVDIKDYWTDPSGKRVPQGSPDAKLRTLYVSSLWKYAGLDVAADGRGRSKRKEHLVEVPYTDAAGKPAVRQGITYNPFLKTKLVEVLGSGFLKVGPERSPYAARYYDHKTRLESHVKYGTANDDAKDDDGRRIASPGRRHRASIRVIVKQFLCDLYVAWRPLEGQTVHPPYHEAKLGIRHGEPAVRIA